MFSEVRKQLTLFNSVVMGLFLVFFVIAAFVSLIWGIYFEEKKDILVYAREEAEEDLDLVKSKEFLKPGFSKRKYQENGTLFYYVYDNRGKLIRYSSPLRENRLEVRRKIADGTMRPGKPILFTFKHRDERRSVISLVLLPLKEHSKVYGNIYVGKDITEFYLLLKKILWSLIGVLLIFLVAVALLGYFMAGKAMRPIRRSYERQREFLADASHELRTPLSVLLASVDAVQGDAENQMTLFTKQVLEDMKDEIKKMSHIVGDLLTLARSDTPNLKLLKEQFNIESVAEQIIRAMEPLAIQKKINLKLDVSVLEPIYADKERIMQLLLILVDNAIKYTLENGRVGLFIHRAADNGSGIEIVVEDNGIGITPEDQQLIFERFYRVDKVRSRYMGGTGLGLSIAKWIAEIHGGSIQINSEPGKGSKFVVILP